MFNFYQHPRFKLITTLVCLQLVHRFQRRFLNDFFCFSSSCVHYVASFSRLFIFDCPFVISPKPWHLDRVLTIIIESLFYGFNYILLLIYNFTSYVLTSTLLHLAIVMACITPKVTFVCYFIMAIFTLIVTGTVTFPVVTMCYRWTNWNIYMYILVTIIFRLMDMSQSQLPLRTVSVDNVWGT
jgi:hypothetical protein